MLPQKLISQKSILLTSLAILFSLIVMLTFWRVNNTLSCNMSTEETAITTYAEAFSKGNDYSSNGQAREFLYLYVWQSDKAKQCYLLAIERYNQALNIDPDRADALTNRASTYMSLSQYDKALDDYQKVLEVNPQAQHARLGIARSYERSGQLELAVLKYEEAVQFMEGSAYWTNLYPDSIEEYRAKLEDLQNLLESSEN